MIQATGGLTDTGTVNVEMEGLFVEGEEVTLIDAGSGTPSAVYMVSDTALVDYETQTDAGESTVVVRASFLPSETVAGNLGTTLQAATGLSQVSQALAASERLGTAAGMFTQAMREGGAMARQVAEELTVQPEALGSASDSAVNNSTQAVGITTARLASLRAGRSYAGGVGTGGYGFSAGDSPVERSVWFKPFGNVIDKRSDNGIPGYSSRTGGVVAGWEREVGEAMNAGMALGYAETEVGGEGAGNVRLETTHYQALLYGDYSREDFYLEGNVSVGRNRTETRRTLSSVGGGTAQGDFNGWQYNATVQMGWPRIWKKNTYFTPLGGVSWTPSEFGELHRDGGQQCGA